MERSPTIIFLVSRCHRNHGHCCRTVPPKLPRSHQSPDRCCVQCCREFSGRAKEIEGEERIVNERHTLCLQSRLEVIDHEIVCFSRCREFSGRRLPSLSHICVGEV
ncbi:hypothetical protein SESBI_42919 [Sesbania bispinosa]|nr:hypothetical protein SESBI_42919 [Sesbania bispinosa]